ncbi:macrolide export ATP-binding/permease protein MacB [Clostridium ragsdalei P11]|uniref:Macrolide export ATP-binding/permease protein MacB n=1 Tax=Clostridium ragsdalei P11 TaxID=1353534 RepID=A0A1A6B4A9_9CLOT|nr:ABC transporter ATP-binding protein [Clostridium ragsdalei]OBR97137.1 macrolide export ATP-binding/permease protein MacB [Clostridium ragsdalei P11]
MIIKLENLVKIYDTGAVKLKALKKINLEIEKTEYVAIMGASGSGKSTLMNVLGCLDKLTDGKYYLDGVDISSLDDNSLADIRNKKIGFVFQAFNLLPKLTAIANVELPMMYAGVSKKERERKAKWALDRVGLSHRLHHKPNEMSGGQKQRVAIARALVNDPTIILADEPTGNLDSVSSEEIMEIFQQLNDEGVTIVMVTHEPDIAMHTKRTIVFKDGTIISDNPVEKRTIVGGQK